VLKLIGLFAVSVSIAVLRLFLFGFQGFEHLDDVFGHWGRCGKMVTGGLESVLISDPVDSDDDTIGSRVRVRALGDSTDIFWLLSDLFLASTGLNLDAISALETILQFLSN